MDIKISVTTYRDQDQLRNRFKPVVINQGGGGLSAHNIQAAQNHLHLVSYR